MDLFLVKQYTRMKTGRLSMKNKYGRCCNVGRVYHWGKPHDGQLWLQPHPSSAWPRWRKRSKMVSLCTTQIARTVLLVCTWILYSHFKIVLVLRRRYSITIRCNAGKRRILPRRWLHHFDFQHWRWLQALMTMVASNPTSNFWCTHSWSPADK